MHRYGILPKSINIIHQLYEHSASQISHTGMLTNHFAVDWSETRLLVSPLIFLLVVDWIMKKKFTNSWKILTSPTMWTSSPIGSNMHRPNWVVFQMRRSKQAWKLTQKRQNWWKSRSSKHHSSLEEKTSKRPRHSLTSAALSAKMMEQMKTSGAKSTKPGTHLTLFDLCGIPVHSPSSKRLEYSILT